LLGPQYRDAFYILISILTIQCRTRQTEAEQYIQEEYIKYSKILIYSSIVVTEHNNGFRIQLGVRQFEWLDRFVPL